MKSIYKGPMRKLVVSKLEVTDGAVRLLEYDTPIIKRDLTFYKGLFNSLISFEYGTRLPDQEEAIDFVKNAVAGRESTEGPYPVCPFVNDEEVKYSHDICDHNFKVLKKFYRNMRREEKKKK